MEIRKLSPALQEKAERELYEKPYRVASDIQTIRIWLEKQPHLQSVRPSDQWILAFLRGNKFSLERSKEKLDMYYTLRTVVPEMFRHKDPLDPRIQEILQLGIFLPLRTCSAEDACRVCITRFGEFDANQYSMVDVLKVTFMIIEVLILEDDNYVIAGEDVLVDLKGVGLSTLTQFTPALAKKIVICMEKALPIRMKSSHLMHSSSGIDTAYSLFNTFVSEKIKKRFHMHGENFEAMYEYFPRKILPKEYGGEDGTVQELIGHWKSKVEGYREMFLRAEDERSEESLRPDKPKTSSNLFGVEGSFRKLEVD